MMKVTHETDRRTTIDIKPGLRVTWTQPHDQSYRPEAIQETVQRAETGDAFAKAELQYLAFNYKLSVLSL